MNSSASFCSQSELLSVFARSQRDLIRRISVKMLLRWKAKDCECESTLLKFLDTDLDPKALAHIRRRLSCYWFTQSLPAGLYYAAAGRQNMYASAFIIDSTYMPTRSDAFGIQTVFICMYSAARRRSMRKSARDGREWNGIRGLSGLQQRARVPRHV